MVRLPVQAALVVAWLALFVHSATLPRSHFSSLQAPSYQRHNASQYARSELASDGASPLRKVATTLDIQRARRIVKDAIAQASVLNKERLENPVRTPHGRGPSKVRRSEVPQLLTVTPEIASAAALLAEADAQDEGLGNSTKRSLHARGSYWMESIARKGTVPWGNDPDYRVFRNVKDYGARGDGRTDDTAAIMKAMTEGKRCGENCNGSTTKNAIVYFPPGTYLVSTTIDVYYGTQVIGDAEDRPIIKAAASFVGLGVLSTDKYAGGVGTDGNDNEWYVNTASFYRQIRNLIIDITSTDPNAYVCALHYQVAQATSIQYLDLVAKTGTTQQGIYAENGSGGHMSDITFKGGNFGFYGGAQQFTAQRMHFVGCKTAVQLIWDWGWLWKEVSIQNSDVGFRLLGEGGSGTIGSVTIMDSVFTNVGTGVIVAPVSDKPGAGSTGIVLDNVRFTGGAAFVKDSAGATLLGAGNVDDWTLGPTYNAGYRGWAEGKSRPYVRNAGTLLGDSWGGLPNKPYFERPRPSYGGLSAGDFVHLKDYALGDGVSDDTAGVQRALLENAGGKIIFADAGTYLIMDTVFVPPGTRIVGETWTQFAAAGDRFSDVNNPRVMFQVGKEGDVGDLEIQDLLFTTKGATAGAVLLEWNIQAASPGSAGIWDSHVRIGGALGTGLTPAECPALTNGEVRSGCIAGTMMMHITREASGYFENMWLWIADHMVDDPDLESGTNEMTQISVYVARGLLVESQNAVWLYGTASEHATLYQYSFYGATNVLAGLVQTETPYYQPTPRAPIPFENTVGMFFGDTDFDCGKTEFDGCDSSWGLILDGCKDVYIPSAGIYSWFSTYSQSCIDGHECQKALVFLGKNDENLRIQNLITIGAANSVVYDQGAQTVGALDNLAVEAHPAWSQITIFDAPPIVHGDDDDKDDNGVQCGDDKYWRSSLETIQAGLGDMDELCVPVYAIPVLDEMLTKAMDEYNDVNQGYDDVFSYYVKSVKDMVQPRIDEYMKWPMTTGLETDWTEGPGNKYFTCERIEQGKVTERGTCTMGWVWNAVGDAHVRYTLADEDGFFKELADDYGIQRDWVQFGTYTQRSDCIYVPDKKTCERWVHQRDGYPLLANDIDVPNPKDIISKAQGGVDTLRDTMTITFLDINSGSWDGLAEDVVEVLATPVSLMEQAIDSMRKAKAIAERRHDDEVRQLVATIVSSVFMLIPLAGEALGFAASALVRTLGSILVLVGELGNAALALKDIVDNPELAPLAIMGMLGGFGAKGGKGPRRSPEDFAEMAKTKRLMKADDVAKAGAIFKKNDDMITNMVSTCNKRF